MRPTNLALMTAVALVAAVAGVWLVAPRLGGGEADPPPPSNPATQSPPVGQPTVSPTAEASPPASPDPPPTAAERAGAVFDQMTQEERLGQLIMATVYANSGGSLTGLIQERHVGSVLLLGDGWGSAAQVLAVCADLQQLAGATPLLIAVDQEGGRVQHLHGDGFDPMPSALAQGRLEAAELSRQAQGWGAQLRDAGVNVNLAPVADVVMLPNPSDNAPVGALERSFAPGADAELVGTQAAAFIAGMSQAGVGSAVKHFPGLGAVPANTDFSSSGITDSITSADAVPIQAFKLALAARPTMVMISHAIYTQIDPAAPAVFSQVIVTDLLRGTLGWDGVVISDSLGAAAVQNVPVGERATRFVAAGGDLAVFTTVADAAAGLDALLAEAAASPEFSRLADQAALRVLTAKVDLGLLD